MEYLDKKASAEYNTASGIWAICGEGGTVLICGDSASRIGIISGVTNGRELISVEELADFEDALKKCMDGGDVSILLGAADGERIIHIRRTKLFSSYAAELRYYENKAEYLAASGAEHGRFDRVLKHIERNIEDTVALLCEISQGNGINRQYAAKVAEQTRLCGLSLIQRYSEPPEEQELCDAVTVFDMITDYFGGENTVPFKAVFVKDITKSAVICNAQSERIVGVTVLASAVAARLSQNGECTVTLSNDGDSAVIEAECILRDGCRLYGRSDRFDQVYGCIPSDPVELLLLEQLASIPQWNLEYAASGDGKAVIRAVLSRYTDPDRLKYRDSVGGVPGALDQYMNYIKASFSLDSEKKSEDQ